MATGSSKYASYNLGVKKGYISPAKKRSPQRSVTSGYSNSEVPF
jgi:hypothetical protein